MRRKSVTATSLAMLVLVAGAWTMAGQGKAGTSGMAPAQQTATQFYMSYRAAFDKATKIEDIMPFMCEANRKQAAAQSKADRDQMFGMVKALDSNTKIKVVKEDRQTDGSVVLSVTAFDTSQKKDVTGKATILKEGGAWKLREENWGS